MPRLVLYEDDGRELFSGQVSRQNVEIVAGFLARNMRTIRAAAAFKQALGSIGELLGQVNDDRIPPEISGHRPPPAPAPRARRPRGGRR